MRRVLQPTVASAPALTGQYSRSGITATDSLFKEHGGIMRVLLWVLVALSLTVIACQGRRAAESGDTALAQQIAEPSTAASPGREAGPDRLVAAGKETELYQQHQRQRHLETPSRYAMHLQRLTASAEPAAQHAGALKKCSPTC
jgi:hypothetical protein